ncbi:MAG: VacJ family lipoprotein [Comamonadaceae bacterium]|nr:VacJ family lipoprotein [Comamonadaceae bacterium]
MNNRAACCRPIAVDEAALDKYVYLRDAYLQRRCNLIFDGSRRTSQRRAADYAPCVDAGQTRRCRR